MTHGFAKRSRAAAINTVLADVDIGRLIIRIRKVVIHAFIIEDLVRK
jgi:hypothetical protein